MEIISIVYIANATLLILHEIESAYEKEWELLRLPGKLTGFLLLHIPILFLLFYGLIEIDRNSDTGLIFGMFWGIIGMLPFFVHKVIIKTPDKFNKAISSAVIYINILSGISLVILSMRMMKP